MTSRTEVFLRAFGREPTREARAPGRVNSIGEHVDYCGLDVLPIAIQRAVRVTFAPRDDHRVRLVSSDPRHAACEISLRAPGEASGTGGWSEYPRAAARMLVERFGVSRGLDALVDGDVPQAAGLSSSSALVVATMLALLDASAVHVSLRDRMELAARAERFVGVDSGGMDQAISLGGRAGHALRIGFEPLTLSAVALPIEWRFVIANSLVAAEKAGRSRAAYNQRVAECARALRELLARPEAARWPRTWRGIVASVPPDEALALADRALEPSIARRARHVLTEGRRVDAAVRAIEDADRRAFGALMDASHASLRDDYEVSCAELDELVAIARDAGADGARLTGAGFGGSIVALVDASRVEAVATALRGRYSGYRGGVPRDAVLVAVASDGACVRSV